MPQPVFICMRNLFLLTLGTMVCCGTSTEATSTVCPSAQNNEKGVGLPCSSHDDCAGLNASFCPAAEDTVDWDFCTRPCNIFVPDGDILSCGSDTQCVGHGWGPALCAPTVCGETLAVQPIYPDASIPCDVTEAVNDLGVGKPCEVHADCAEQPAGKCPQDIHAELPTWCSMLCDGHSDCGDSAFCWHRPSVDGGLVGSCAPITCRIYPEINTDCVPGVVNQLGLGQFCLTDEDCIKLSTIKCLAGNKSLSLSICTQSCIHDEDCGANAMCFTLPESQESTCIPISCMI
jgi:hypothetical protein